MQFDTFNHLPDESRVWIYGFASDLSGEEEKRIRQRLGAFLEQWETHGRPVRGAFEIVDKRFVILAGHAPAGISGCSVDASVRVFKKLREEGLDGLERTRIYYRTPGGSVESTDFTKFQEVIDQGRLGSDPRVFDTHVAELGQLRAGGFEKPLLESWHARTVSLPQRLRG